jgi:hypothetical protein
LATGSYDAYTGVYRAGPDHTIGVTRFVTYSGEDTILISDSQSGVVRRLFQVADGEFVMGPAFAVREPVELTVSFVDDAEGDARGWRPASSMRSAPGCVHEAAEDGKQNSVGRDHGVPPCCSYRKQAPEPKLPQRA